jgi:hypothetical protein
MKRLIIILILSLAVSLTLAEINPSLVVNAQLRIRKRFGEVLFLDDLITSNFNIAVINKKINGGQIKIYLTQKCSNNTTYQRISGKLHTFDNVHPNQTYQYTFEAVPNDCQYSYDVTYLNQMTLKEKPKSLSLFDVIKHVVIRYAYADFPQELSEGIIIDSCSGIIETDPNGLRKCVKTIDNIDDVTSQSSIIKSLNIGDSACSQFVDSLYANRNCASFGNLQPFNQLEILEDAEGQLNCELWPRGSGTTTTSWFKVRVINGVHAGKIGYFPKEKIETIEHCNAAFTNPYLNQVNPACRQLIPGDEAVTCTVDWIREHFKSNECPTCNEPLDELSYVQAAVICNKESGGQENSEYKGCCKDTEAGCRYDGAGINYSLGILHINMPAHEPWMFIAPAARNPCFLDPSQTQRRRQVEAQYKTGSFSAAKARTLWESRGRRWGGSSGWTTADLCGIP